MARIVRYTIAGMLGAVIAWASMEWTPLMPESYTPGVEVSIPFWGLCVMGIVSGLLIGLALGLAEGMSGLSPREAGKTLMMGAIFGAAGGLVGFVAGNAIYVGLCSLAGDPFASRLPSNIPHEARPASEAGPFSFLLRLIGRSSGWALLGLMIGLAPGLATGSTKKMNNGAVGGFLGGAIGGCTFEILKWMNVGGVSNFPQEMIRFVSFAVTGAAIGLFIGFIEEVAKKAWLVRLVGRNEGQEYTIFKPVTVLGRSEFVDVPVFTDPDVAEKHAAILAINRRHLIEDLGSFSGTHVNGVAVRKEYLSDGDTITIGKTRFLFRDKATRSNRVPQTSYHDSGVSIPTAQNVCPFCGATKDASGNCQCAVGAAPVAPTQDVSNATAQMPGANVTAQMPSPQAAPHGPQLIATSGPYAGQAFPLRAGETFIGRDATKDVPLSMDNTVSRNHAHIALELGVYVLYDDGSTNGSFVNGTRITRRELGNADVVQVGSSKFRVEL